MSALSDGSIVCFFLCYGCRCTGALMRGPYWRKVAPTRLCKRGSSRSRRRRRRRRTSSCCWSITNSRMASKWRMSFLRLGDSSFLFVVSQILTLISEQHGQYGSFITAHTLKNKKTPSLSLSKDPFLVCPTCLLKNPSSSMVSQFYLTAAKAT